MMNRITIHHTGGSYSPSGLDLEHYHFVVDGEGSLHHGDFQVMANSGALVEGHYAAHTRGLNSGNIGVSMAAMAGAQWARPRDTKFPPTPAQVASMIRLVADLCREWGIQVSSETVLSHAEVEITLGVKQKGKWDFDYDFISGGDSRDPVYIGDKMRSAVSAILKKSGSKIAPVVSASPVLKRGSVGKDVEKLQRLLGVKPDGAFGPLTWNAVVAFQKRNSLRPDGVVGRMTWAILERK